MANLEKNLVSCMILLAISSICLGQSCHLVGNCFINAGTTVGVLEGIHVNPFDLDTLMTIENTYCMDNFCTRYQNCLHAAFPYCERQVLAPYIVLESMINLVCRQESKTQNTCLEKPEIQHAMRNIFDFVIQEIDSGKCSYSVYEQFRHFLSHDDFSHYCKASDLYYILDLFNASMRPYTEAEGCPVMI